MEFNYIKVNNQLCRVYYAFTYEEMKEMYDELVDSFEGVIGRRIEAVLKMYLYEYIENQLLEEKLLDENIICVSSKDVRHLTEYKKNRPFIGVATFATLPVGEGFILPEFINEGDSAVIFNKANANFKEKMLQKGFYYRDETNVVSEKSIIVYDLNCIKNEVLINSIEDQEFDMINDEEFDKKLFINCQVGDHVIVDQDEFITEAVIKKIYEKKPFNDENFDYTMIEKFECNSFGEFRNKYINAAVKDIKEQEIINDFIKFVIEHNENYKLSEELIDFYKRICKLNDEECAKKIYTDYFLKIFAVKDNIKVTTEETDEIVEDVFVLDFGANDNAETPLLINRKFNDFKIIKGLRQRKIIK